MLVFDKSSAYFTNPIIIGFLKKWNLIVDSTEVQKSILLLLLPLLDRIFSLSWKDRNKIVREENYRELTKFVGNDPKFSSSLIRLVKEINLSNLIRKTYHAYPSVKIQGSRNTGTGNCCLPLECWIV